MILRNQSSRQRFHHDPSMIKPWLLIRLALSALVFLTSLFGPPYRAGAPGEDTLVFSGMVALNILIGGAMLTAVMVPLWLTLMLVVSLLTPVSKAWRPMDWSWTSNPFGDPIQLTHFLGSLLLLQSLAASIHLAASGERHAAAWAMTGVAIAMGLACWLAAFFGGLIFRSRLRGTGAH